MALIKKITSSSARRRLIGQSLVDSSNNRNGGSLNRNEFLFFFQFRQKDSEALKKMVRLETTSDWSSVWIASANHSSFLTSSVDSSNNNPETVDHWIAMIFSTNVAKKTVNTPKKMVGLETTSDWSSVWIASANHSSFFFFTEFGLVEGFLLFFLVAAGFSGCFVCFFWFIFYFYFLIFTLEGPAVVLWLRPMAARPKQPGES